MNPEVRDVLRQTITSWEHLADFLELNEAQRSQITVNQKFPLKLPIRIARKIAKKTLDDPLLKQFLPTREEEVSMDGFISDPVGDQLARQSDLLIHKYRGRVLLVCTSACALHCRYCFRQHFNYAGGKSGFEKEIDIIATDPTIHEVILSGGDPLSLNDRQLGDLLEQIGQISHVKRIRFHTRFPVAVPERITEEFLTSLKRLRQSIWFVLHINHANELDDDVLAALGELRAIGVHLLNQAVLLKGVNDNTETLAQLCETLVDNGILPYYLHQLDRVAGAAHFEVEESVGENLIKELAARLPGYAVPKYVKEISGEPSKTPIINST